MCHPPQPPMQVYAWFMIVFRLSVGTGFAGYILLLLDFTGAGMLLRPLLGPGAAITGASSAGGEREPPCGSCNLNLFLPAAAQLL